MTREDFADLALSYLEEVTAYARRLAHADWEADDLIQATYERGFRKWKDLRDRARCRAWLFRIARNLHIDRIRTTATRSELRLVDSEPMLPAVSPEVVERANRDALERALASIASDQREAVLLGDLWGFRYSEIAEIVNAPIGTVRSRISRGRAALVSALASLESEIPHRGVQP